MEIDHHNQLTLSFMNLTPSLPRSDYHVTSPYNIDISSNKKVTRIHELIR